MILKGAQNLSFKERLNVLCPLFKVSFKRGSLYIIVYFHACELGPEMTLILSLYFNCNGSHGAFLSITLVMAGI